MIRLAIAAVLILGLRNTVYGRHLYALGVNRTSAARVPISEIAYWTGAYMLSGAFAALTGALLLGWSGGGFIGVGDQYLFMTLAAVVVGGTSLLGGCGGYGFTVIGVLVPQALDLVPGRPRAQLRVAAVHLRNPDPADNRALRALAAYPYADLSGRGQEHERE